MDDAAASPPPPPLPTITTETPRPFGVGRGAVVGAGTGFRVVSWVALPIAAVFFNLGLALTVFGVGSGRGWGVHKVVPRSIGFYACCAFLGAVFGGAVGMTAGAIARVFPRSRLAKAGAAANRPIGLWLRVPFCRRRTEFDPSSAPPRSLARIGVWLVGVPALVLLVGGYGAGVYFGRLVDRRLAAANAEADRDDPAWRIDDLMAAREVVPDDENSALVLAEVVAALPDGWPNGPAPRPGLPYPPTEVSRAYDRMTKTADNVRLDDATAHTLRADLDKSAATVALARSAAEYDRGRHELTLGPTLIDTPLPETQAARTPARLMSADAAVRAHDGDLDGALDSCRALLAAGRSIGDEPFLVSHLVRVAIGNVAARSATRVLGQGEPSDEALAKLQALFLDEASQPLLLHGLKGERAIMTEVIRRIGSGEMPIAALSSGPPPDPDGPVPAVGPWARLWYDNQEAQATEWLNQVVAIARKPAPERPPLLKAWQAEFDRVRSSRFEPYIATLPVLLIPAVESAFTTQARFRCVLDTTVLVLAAERHRKKTGDWPASAGALDPEILPTPPLDPYSGGPYRFSRGGGRLLVYSIGPDLKDEAGAYVLKTWGKNLGKDDVGAAAWDVSRRRLPPTPIPDRDAATD